MGSTVELIPWEEFEEEYSETFSESGMGAPAKPFRMALGALLIKESLNITDEETVQQIRGTPIFSILSEWRDTGMKNPSVLQ